MLKNLIYAIGELNEVDDLKKTLSSSLEELKNNVNLDEVKDYVRKGAESPVLNVLSPRTARNLQVARMLLEGATEAYAHYQSKNQAHDLSESDYSSHEHQNLEQPIDFPQEAMQAASFANQNRQEAIYQQNEQAFWEQERLDYENLQYDQQQNELAYNQMQDDYVYQDFQTDYYSDY